MRPVLLAALTAGALVRLGGAAPAAAEVGVAALATREAPATPAQVSAAISAALERAGQPVRDGAVGAARTGFAAGGIGIERLAGFRRVSDLIDEGWRAYLEVQTEFAVARLGEARRQAEALLPLAGGPELYADAALRLGGALDNAGRRDEADEVLRLASALDPDRPITVQEFSPDVVAAHARAGRARPASRTLRIRVRGPGGDELAGAFVEVDGVPVGAAPVERAVEVGQHVVVVRSAGHLARGETIAVSAATTAEVVVELDADPVGQALAAGIGAGTPEAVAAAWVEGTLRHAELDAVVLVAAVWRSARPALLAQRCEAPARCTGIVEVGYEGAGLEVAARAVVEELARAGAPGGRSYPPGLTEDPRLARGERPAAPGPARCGWCRPALWAGLGVVTAAAAVTVVLLVGGGDGGTEVVIEPGDFVPR